MIAQRIEPTLSLMAITLVLVDRRRGAARRGRRLEGRHLDRPRHHGVRGVRLLGAGVRGRLPARLCVRAASSNGCRCRATRRSREGVWPWLQNLILPAIALGCVYIALIARITRATMLEVLQQDYIRTARAKGLGQRGILFVHALKNAAVPIVTVIGIGIALLIGGAVVTESVFAIPGLGRLTVDAILRRDYPVIQGIVLLFSFVYVLVNLVVDLTLHAARPEDPLLTASTASTAPVPPGVVVAPQLPDLLPPVKVAARRRRLPARPSDRRDRRRAAARASC